MKLVHLFFGDKPDVKWQLVSQMGIRYAFAKLAPELTGKKPITDFETLKAQKELFAEHGFDLIGLEGDQIDMMRIKLGLPGREEDIEQYKQMLRNMGKLGITTLCYNFMPTGWFRTSKELPERGGAFVTGFSKEDGDKLPMTEYGEVSEEKMWENYELFISQVMPVAEEAGVRMGLHPDDPPVSPLQGIARIFTNPDAIRRVLSLSDSPSHGLTFCQGTYVTMGAPVADVIREWKDRIFFVHQRDVAGGAENFHETFHDNGPTDMPAMLRVYKEVGYDGPLRSDHVPTMAGEDNSQPSYGISGTLFGVGYLKGMMDAIGIEY